MPAATNMTTAGADLKELYTLPPVRVLNDKSFLHDKLTKEAAQVDYSGKYVRWPVTVQRAMGQGSRGDGGELPVAEAEVELEAKAYIKFNYYALEWTEAIELVSKNQAGAFESVVKRKMKNVSTDLAKSINRMFYNSSNGTVAMASASTSGADTLTALNRTQFVQVGEFYDIVTLSTGVPITNGTRRQCTAVNRTTGVITFGDGGGNLAVTATTHGIVVTGNWGNETEGLRHITDDARSLHGIDSSTYSNWDGTVHSLSSAIAGEAAFERLYDKIGAKGRGDIDTYLTTRGVRSRLADEFASQRRYLNEKSLDIKAGYRSIEVNGQECIIDDDCPKGYVIALKREALKILKLCEPGFIESEAGDGAKVELKNSTTAGRKVASFQSWYRYHLALACEDPGVTGQIPDAADDFAD